MLVLLAAMTSSLQAGAQSWGEVKKNVDNRYIYGEGSGSTLEEADKDALRKINSQICVAVQADYQARTRVVNGVSEMQMDKVINTFSRSTLKNTHYIMLHKEPKAQVGRWIERSELEKIFDERRARVMEFVRLGVEAESKGKADNALRCYYWAQALLQTLQYPGKEKYIDGNGQAHTLTSWLPEKMNGIFSDLQFCVTSRGEGNVLELYITFRGDEVASLDYTYFDGSIWSSIYSAKDGKGVLELAPGNIPGRVQLKVEYAYTDQAHVDNELYQVLDVIRGQPMSKAYFNVSTAVRKKNVKAEAASDLAEVTETASVLTRVDDETVIRESMSRIIESVQRGTYAGVRELFTADGFDMYTRLLAYGQASLVGTPQYDMYNLMGQTVVRSVPMSFRFSTGMRRAFVEDVVFTFNQEGLVDCISFGLDDAAVNDVLVKHKDDWNETARMSIIQFLENYKTAFALKRIDYIRSIFDDDAIIIVGKVTKKTDASDASNLQYKDNVYVQKTRLSKTQYINNLERCFAGNEYVNIRFASNDIVRAGDPNAGELYGIQIKQDYYSSNYGDTGYLFLLVDLNDQDAPVIKVRTWQDQPDPELGDTGLYDMSIF